MHCENSLDKIAVDSFVAVYLSIWENVPEIGKVLNVMEDKFGSHYWKGSYANGPLKMPLEFKLLMWSEHTSLNLCHSLGRFSVRQQ